MSVGIITDCYGNIRWKWDYVGDAVPVRGRRLNNLNSMRNEDDYPTYSTNIVDCFIKETKINENIRRNAEMVKYCMAEYCKEILEERDRLAERCKYLENACKFSYRAFLRFTRMPDITDYTYDSDTATTTIIWSDNTTTTVTAEDKATADQYTGFMTAYAKKAAGNTSRIQALYERAIKLPEKKALAEQKAKEKEEEQKKIRENQKARKRKEEYEKSLIREEAKRLAEKEYGVPYDNNDWLNTGEDKGHETT